MRGSLADGGGTHALLVAQCALVKAPNDVSLLEEAAEHFQKLKKVRERLPVFVPVANFIPSWVVTAFIYWRKTSMVLRHSLKRSLTVNKGLSGVKIGRVAGEAFSR
jgi:hypothetical protein